MVFEEIADWFWDFDPGPSLPRKSAIGGGYNIFNIRKCREFMKPVNQVYYLIMVSISCTHLHARPYTAKS
jgi:hypothetical protein